MVYLRHLHLIFLSLIHNLVHINTNVIQVIMIQSADVIPQEYNFNITSTEWISS